MAPPPIPAPGGFVRLYRRVYDHPAFANKAEASLFVWMITTAQWRPTTIRTALGPVELDTGELIVAERVLAEDFGMHRNAVRKVIQRLVDSESITLFRDRTSRRNGTVVRINNYQEYQGIEDVSEDDQDRSGTVDGTKEGPKRDRSGTKNNEGKDSKEKKEDIYAQTHGLTERAPAQPALTLTAPPASAPSKPPADAFEAFWAAYPRKTGKDAARRAWASAVKRAEGVGVIMAGLKRYRWPFDKQFIPHPATWLNQGRWMDEPDAPTPAPQAPPPHPPTSRPRDAAGTVLSLDDLGEMGL